MRPADTTDHPTTSTTWSESDLVELTIRLANQPTAEPAEEIAAGPLRVPTTQFATELAAELVPGSTNQLPEPSTQPAPAYAGPLAGRVTHPGGGVLRSSTAPTHPGAAALRPPTTSADAAWSVPLLITPGVEAWLLGWPAGVVTPAHGHGGATVAVTVVEGSLSEECLDPTIWTTGRRTTWRAGASTLFPSGHVHLLGAAGDRPAVAVHAWSGLAGSADRVAGRLALARGGAVA
jgi:quercetin dioxygenase-like cupin family protein